MKDNDSNIITVIILLIFGLITGLCMLIYHIAKSILLNIRNKREQLQIEKEEIQFELQEIENLWKSGKPLKIKRFTDLLSKTDKDPDYMDHMFKTSKKKETIYIWPRIR